ncbi:MAG: peptidylprolyl isomerase [Candidatus Saccharimonadales bacterium]
MKRKKLPKLQLPSAQKLKKLKRPHIKKKDAATRFDEALKNLPNITNETLASQREEVIGGARKYIYPLKQSKHNIVRYSIGFFVLIVLVFFGYSLLVIYKFQTHSSFIYAVSEVIPFPAAKAGPRWVSYQDYLFQLRHYIHYYQNQQQVNFSSKSGKAQLANFKKLALKQVINQGYIKQLAAKNHVSVSPNEVNNELNLVRREDRLGSTNKQLDGVLSQFYGWTEADFKTELKQQLLAQKVVSKLDSATHQRAQNALDLLNSGKTKFSEVAKQYSEDTATNANGGKFGFIINQSSQNVPPQTLATLQTLKPGQISGIVDLGNALEIDKVISSKHGQIKAGHILFNFKSINSFIKPLKASQKPRVFIKD